MLIHRGLYTKRVRKSRFSEDPSADRNTISYGLIESPLSRRDEVDGDDEWEIFNETCERVFSPRPVGG